MSRLGKIKKLMEKNSLDGFYINYIPNIRYLSNFSGSSASLLLTQNKDYFFTDFRYKDQSHFEVKEFEIIINYDSSIELAKILENNKLKKIAFESSHMTYSSLDKMKSKFTQAEFIPLMEEIEKLTNQKLPEEIEKIRKAVEITDKVFSKILEFLKPGLTENDVSAEITYQHKKSGASEDSFHPIVASGWRGALPHGRASNKVIENGEMVTLDFGCSYQGFCSDLTRTLSVGKPKEELKKIYGIVFDAHRRAIDKANASLTSKQLDEVARDFITSSGYGENFGHGLGHGLGIDVHELPSVSQRMDMELKENYVVTIEPGIYVEKLGGVRIEDDIVIKNDGCEVLNKSPRELIII
jgi:Xaa-Pro aminopeptidase